MGISQHTSSMSVSYQQHTSLWCHQHLFDCRVVLVIQRMPLVGGLYQQQAADKDYILLNGTRHLQFRYGFVLSAVPCPERAVSNVYSIGHEAIICVLLWCHGSLFVFSQSSSPSPIDLKGIYQHSISDGYPCSKTSVLYRIQAVIVSYRFKLWDQLLDVRLFSGWIITPTFLSVQW